MGRGRVLIAIPTLASRDLTHLSSALGTLPAWVDAVFFLNGPRANSEYATALAERLGSHVQLVDGTGYSCVRNAILDHSYGRYEWLIFFDDDQLPIAGWLEGLLAVTDREPGYSVVIGPRVGVSRGSAYFPAEYVRSPEQLSWCDMPFAGDVYTGNTLISVPFLENTRIRFAMEYNEVGGEDTAFFREVRAVGGSVGFSERALVIELIPPERRGVVGLARLSGLNAQRNALLARRSPLGLVMRIVAHLGRGVLLTLSGVLLPSERRLALAVKAVGMGLGYRQAMRAHR
jgi:hypothetical protein